MWFNHCSIDYKALKSALQQVQGKLQGKLHSSNAAKYIMIISFQVIFASRNSFCKFFHSILSIVIPYLFCMKRIRIILALFIIASAASAQN